MHMMLIYYLYKQIQIYRNGSFTTAQLNFAVLCSDFKSTTSEFNPLPELYAQTGGPSQNPHSLTGQAAQLFQLLPSRADPEG